MRLEGWEQRLHAIIEAARHQPYVRGEHDCVRLVCRVVEALTGVDRWPEFAGYATLRDSIRRMQEYGDSPEAAGDWFFGGEQRVPVRQARRGDVVLLPTEHLTVGVCVDHRAACLLESGLALIPMQQACTAWRVG